MVSMILEYITVFQSGWLSSASGNGISFILKLCNWGLNGMTQNKPRITTCTVTSGMVKSGRRLDLIIHYKPDNSPWYKKINCWLVLFTYFATDSEPKLDADKWLRVNMTWFQYTSFLSPNFSWMLEESLRYCCMSTFSSSLMVSFWYSAFQMFMLSLTHTHIHTHTPKVIQNQTHSYTMKKRSWCQTIATFKNEMRRRTRPTWFTILGIKWNK